MMLIVIYLFRKLDNLIFKKCKILLNLEENGKEIKITTCGSRIFKLRSKNDCRLHEKSNN